MFFEFIANIENSLANNKYKGEPGECPICSEEEQAISSPESQKLTVLDTVR